jgi:hypothetical protein
MYQDYPWNPWQNPPQSGVAVGSNREKDPIDLLHEYVTRLNAVIARAQENAVDLALQQLERVPRPTHDDLAATTLLERKRRELLEQFNMVRHEISMVPGLTLDAWLAYFFTSAELSGSMAVTVVWHEPPEGFPAVMAVPVEQGALFRASLHELGVPLEWMREINHVAANGRGQAALEVATTTLTLSGAPFFFEQSKRALDAHSGEAPLACSFAYDRARDVQEGMLLAVKLNVRNLSNDFMVLEELDTDNSYDQREVFRRPSLGKLVYDEAGDRFTYQSVAPGVTGTPFHTAVLRPGEERSTVVNLKMLDGGDSWRQFRLRYRRFRPDEFRQVAYVPLPKAMDQFPPNVVYAPMQEAPNPEKVDLLTIVLSPKLEGPCHEAIWYYPFHIGRRPFSLAQARKRLPDGGEPVHFSRWQQAWVLRTEGGCALVTQTRVTAYPRVEAEAFVLIDESEQRVPVRFDDAVLPAFKSLPMGITDWESHGLGLSVSLPKHKLTTFFQELERMGCSLKLTRNLLGRQSLFVTS